MSLPIKILLFFEILASLTGLYYYKKVKGTFWGMFPFYLIFIVLAELTGYFLNVYFPEKPQYNSHFFDYLEIPISFLFFFRIFYRSITKPGYRITTIACTIIYLIIWLADIFYFSGKIRLFDSISYTMGNLLLLILIVGFFINLVSSDEIITFRQNMLFWVSLGLLIFYLGSFPYFGLVNLLAKTHTDMMKQYYSIVMAFDSLMYVMFTISFIWGEPRTNS